MRKIFLIALTFCLFLTSCTYSDLGELTSNDDKEKNPSVYNNDYSLKPYLSGQDMFFYQNKIFFVDGGRYLAYVSIDEMTPDMDLSKGIPEKYSCDYHFTCPYDDEHYHMGFGGTLSCPIRIGSYSTFLLDAYESGGSYPIFYYTYTYPNAITDDPDASNATEPFYLYRYDSSTNIREELIELPGRAIQTMAYGDKIYLSIILSSGESQVMLYDKKTKKTNTLGVGEGRFEFLHANESSVYYGSAVDGTLYKADAALTSAEQAYKPEEAYEVFGSKTGLFGMFVYNDMLYYRSDYRNAKMPVDENAEVVQYYEHPYYNYRRLPLDSLSGEGELVAKDVLGDAEFGVADNAFYFTPCDCGPKDPKGYYNFSNGRLCKVDLDTLVCTDVLTNSGLLFYATGFGYTNGKFIVGTIRSLSEPWTTNWSRSKAAAFYALYDLETGSMYSVYQH